MAGCHPALSATLLLVLLVSNGAAAVSAQGGTNQIWHAFQVVRRRVSMRMSCKASCGCKCAVAMRRTSDGLAVDAGVVHDVPSERVPPDLATSSMRLTAVSTPIAVPGPGMEPSARGPVPCRAGYAKSGAGAFKWAVLWIELSCFRIVTPSWQP